MLGKQGWELLTNHDTILSRVFKAKYYPKEGFLEVKLGHNPSYVWHSIHASQVVVKHGLQWRLGKGDKINVRRQPWLREIDHSLIRTSMIHGKENIKMSDLINHETGSWHRELIHQIFCPRLVRPVELGVSSRKCVYVLEALLV
jgi:hypothetical protein